jgi:hypothetical protein
MPSEDPFRFRRLRFASELTRKAGVEGSNPSVGLVLYEGWSHFREGPEAIERELATTGGAA